MFPRLRLRDEVAVLLDLPVGAAARPLGRRRPPLPGAARRAVAPPRPVPRLGRHRLRAQGAARAGVAEREFDVLRHLEDAGLPAVRAVGLAERPERGDAILVTEYLRHSMQYRRLLMRLRFVERRLPGPAAGRDGPAPGGPPPGRRLLGRLLAREHAVPARRRPDPGVPRRRGDERDRTRRSRTGSAGSTSTSSSRTSPSASPTSPPTRAGRTTWTPRSRRPSPSATRYEAVWRELYDQPELIPGDRRAIRARLRRLNDLGFSRGPRGGPGGPAGAVRLRTSVTTRRYHANELERRTRLRALEGQARILLNDLAEYHAWLECFEQPRPSTPEEAADRWLREVYRPTLARIAGLVGPGPRPRPGVLRRPGAQVAAVRAGRRRRRAWTRRSSPTLRRGHPRPSRPARPATAARWTRWTWSPTTPSGPGGAAELGEPARVRGWPRQRSRWTHLVQRAGGRRAGWAP